MAAKKTKELPWEKKDTKKDTKKKPTKKGKDCM